MNVDTKWLQKRDVIWEFRLESQLQVVAIESFEVKTDFTIIRYSEFPESKSCRNQPNSSQLSDSSRDLYPQQAYNSPNVDVDFQPNMFSVQEYSIPFMLNGKEAN